MAFDVGLVIHSPHLLIRNLTRQPVEDDAQFWMVVERFAADHRDGVIWREVTPVVFERVKIEFRDQAVGGVSGDQIDLTVSSPGGGGFVGESYYVEGVHETVEPLNPTHDLITLTLDLSPKAYFDTNPFPE